MIEQSARLGRVLIIAGSDSGGGAGIQADTKTVTALGGYAMTAVTALTVQNTLGVSDVMGVPPALIAAQMRAVLSDIGADCLKTGMLHNTEVIASVVEVVDEMAADLPLVVDPVMFAKGGHPLLDPAAMAVLKSLLLPRARIVTPNIPEAEAIAERQIGSVTDMEAAAAAIAEQGAAAVLVKGGHREGDVVVDVLFDKGRCRRFEHARIDTPHTHGTGCTLASAIAVGLAAGLDLDAAVERARAYVLEAIRTAPGLGKGHGPLNHAHTVGQFDA